MANVHHYKIELSWESGGYPSLFRHSLKAWLYAPRPGGSTHILHLRYVSYPEDANSIFSRFRKELRKLHNYLFKEDSCDISDIFLDVEQYDVADFRYLGGSRYRVTRDGVALYGSGKETESYALEDFFKIFKGKLENIVRQLQAACWELAAKEVSVSA